MSITFVEIVAGRRFQRDARQRTPRKNTTEFRKDADFMPFVLSARRPVRRSIVTVCNVAESCSGLLFPVDLPICARYVNRCHKGLAFFQVRRDGGLDMDGPGVG